MSCKGAWVVRRVAALLAAAGISWASSPTTWESSSWRDFVTGRFQGVALSRDGRLMLAPRLETVFAADQPVVWSVVRAPDGTLYAGTGHRGRLYRIAPGGRAELLWSAEQPEIFALALDSRGVLYAAASPEGKIYRLQDGKATEYFAPGSRYIWALAFGPDGRLYAGTGDDGKIWRIEGPGRGEVYYETGQTHVTCLAFDAHGRLLAGTEPNGIVYRITAKDKAFALYDSNLPEIRRLTVAPDGSIYVAAMGGSLVKRTPGSTPAAAGSVSTQPSASVTTTVTVTEETQAGVELKPTSEQARPVPAPPPAPASAVIDISGVEKSAIYRIGADNTVETLWSSKEENVYDLLLAGNDLYFGTDGQGRIYRLHLPERKLALVVQTQEGETLRLAEDAAGLLAATGDAGRIYRLAGGTAGSGVYESPVHDAGTVARWGRISWRGEDCDQGRVRIRTRSGNSARPDRTWSEWSEPLNNGDPIPSPNARFIQWRAELAEVGGRTPSIDSVTVAYLPQNAAPVLKSLSVTSQWTGATQAKSSATSQNPTATYTITVTDTGESPPAPSTGTPTQPVGRAGIQQLQITWQAEDSDGDRLSYSVYFRGEDEREWKLLKSNLTENSYTMESEALADGRYFFRVVASDAPSNPPASARQAELVSAPTLIDHTPPLLRAGEPRRAGPHWEVDVEAADAVSPLRRAEYSLDAGPWIPLEPADGVLDSPAERFRILLEDPAPGERLLVVRVFDASGNAGLVRIVLR
ncbi:MAG: hypothetical protein RMI94_11055 [Bryobacterales bacterium]|nr:hypothetical protein [Bryobacteraceae bacterium]MDW8131078.1 hypothetical protein [Bryobacterales bacterium]